MKFASLKNRAESRRTILGFRGTLILGVAAAAAAIFGEPAAGFVISNSRELKLELKLEK